VIRILIILALVIVGEAAALFLVAKGAAAQKKKLDAAIESATAARHELEGLSALMRQQKNMEGEAQDEKQSLEETPDSGLAGRADRLFSS
jgi:hypothetical protein